MNQLRVLNVDDSRRDATAVRRHLSKSSGELVFERVDSAEGMKSAIESKSWDVILAKCAMPDFTVSQALALLRKTGRDIPFIVISGTSDAETAVDAMRAGASDYLTKGQFKRLSAAISREMEEAGNRNVKRLADVESNRFNNENHMDENGKSVGMGGLPIDIDAKRKMEIAPPESGERFQRYFELGLIGMALLSPDKQFLEVNDEVCRILGYERNELLNRSWLEFSHPDDVDADSIQFDRILRGECDGYSLDKRLIHKEGRSVFGVISVKCVRNTDGSVAYFLALLQDNSRGRQLEQALRDSEERYRQLFEGNPDPTFVFDQETLHVVAVNEAAVQEYGYSRAEFLSLTSIDIWQAQDVPQIVEGLTKVPSGPARETVWRNRKKDGTIIEVEITHRPLFFMGQRSWVMIARNVTERRILENQFRQSQKMEAIGQLAGGMAHDFNNLLTVINGYSDLALQRLPREDPTRRDMDEIRRAGERAAALSRQLLAFSRKQVMSPTVLDLNAVITNLERMLRRLIGENIVMHTDLAPDLGCIRADRGQIEQVLMNLVVNACDAMEFGGQVTIETQNVELTPSYFRQGSDRKPGPYVMLVITDTGTGMDTETQAQMFEPFFTTKDVGKGTGLGLSTVSGIIHQTGGAISVYSKVGKGSTLKIYIPRVDAGIRPLEESPSPEMMLLGTETVLLTEDDDMVRALVSRILSMHGYRVLEASNAGTALLICERQNEPIRLLVTDVVMPEMSGPELAERLRKLKPELRVLYMSGYAGQTIVPQRVLDEKTPFVQKPFAPQVFLKIVREILDRPFDRDSPDTSVQGVFAF